MEHATHLEESASGADSSAVESTAVDMTDFEIEELTALMAMTHRC